MGRWQYILAHLGSKKHRAHIARERIARLNGPQNSHVAELLAPDADESKSIPALIEILRNHEGLTGLWTYTSAALDVVSKSTSPLAVDFMLESLSDSNAHPEIRFAAYSRLAGTAGDRGLKAVLAMRDERRTLPSVREYMRIDDIDPASAPDSHGEVSPRRYGSRLLLTYRAEDGLIWGLIASNASGHSGDLWIATHNGHAWSDPVFTGANSHDFAGRKWVEEFCGNTELAKDSDKDGWADLLEDALGTDPYDPDSDGDGLRDSQDKNPLAPPRRLSKAEKVLAAAFHARFRFDPYPEGICIVDLPEGMKPLELMGRDWITIASEDGKRPRIWERQNGRDGSMEVYFDVPNTRSGRLLRRIDKKSWIVWNWNRTRAMLQIATYLGPLAGDAYDVWVKKFGDDWVVTDMKLVWVS